MTERLGDLVIEAKNISKAYGSKVLIDNLYYYLIKNESSVKTLVPKS